MMNAEENHDILRELLNRPSVGSKSEALKYRARFDADRQTQTLQADLQKHFAKLINDVRYIAKLEIARVASGRSALRSMGLVDHSVPSYNWFLHKELTKLIKKYKPWKIADNAKVHIFKIVKAWLLPPITQLIDPQAFEKDPTKLPTQQQQQEQYVPLSPHEARLSNTPYECMIVVDVAHWQMQHPQAVLQPHENPNNRFTLPDGWHKWPVDQRMMHLRVPLQKLALLTMSMLDRRASGTLSPANFAYEDKFDEGGYYMGAGSTVHMPSHETLAHNHVFNFPSAYSQTSEEEACTLPDEKIPFEIREAQAVTGAQVHMHKVHRTEIRCCHPSRRQRSTSTIIVSLSKHSRKRENAQRIQVKMQFLNKLLPSTVIFYALGFTIAESIQLMKSVAGNHWYAKAFDPILRKMQARHPKEVTNQESAWMYIGLQSEKKDPESMKKFAKNVLISDFLPQSGLAEVYNRDKAIEFARIHLQLFWQVVGFSHADSKDHYAFQRYDTNGTMWASLMRQISYPFYLKTDRLIRSAIQQRGVLNWRLLFNEQKNSELQQSCTTRGLWSVNKMLSGSARTGVTLALKNTCYLTYASSVRRANTANKANRRSMKAKQIDEGQFARLCCIETPEGEMCGNARFHTQGSTLSLPSSHKGLLAVLMRWYPQSEWMWAASSFDLNVVKNYPFMVNLDGRFVWRVKSGTDLVQTIRELRRSSFISPHVGVNLDGTMVQIRTSPGRNLRLMLIIKPWFEFLSTIDETAAQSHAYLFKNHLKRALSDGYIEFVDAMEERALSIAFCYEDLVKRTEQRELFSHMEVDPLWMTGLTAGTLPFFHCNQSPRSVLAAAMSKQTFSGLINQNRVNALSHVLDMPTRSLCQSRVFDDYNLHGITIGNPVKLGLYITEYSMEDSWDKNDAASQLGVLRGILLRRYVAANKPWSATRIERFEKPGKDCCVQQAANYDKIQQDGLPLVGTFIQQDDILIGRTTKEVINNSIATSLSRTMNQNTINTQSNKYDDSVAVRDEQGVVLSVRTIITENGMMIKQVVLRTQCLSEIGDKYMGRHGQKGTTGVNRQEADVICSVTTGTPLWIAMNSMQNYARQTSAFNTELLSGKAGALMGEFVNSSGFLSDYWKQKETGIAKALASVGAHPLGYEVHMSGITGKIIPQPIFTGLMHMCPLAHLVGSKIHARDRGPRKRLTRQPDDGRAKNGGLRFGQMELDCLTALGCPHFLLDRLQKSDAFLLAICLQCGLIAESTFGTNYKFCRTCQDSQHVRIVVVSYSNKLFYQELMAMHVRPQLILKPKHGSIEAIKQEKMIVDEKEPHNLQISHHNSPSIYQHDQRKAAEVIDNYFKLTWIPRPQPWEKERYGIPNDLTLHDKLETMASREREREIQERKRLNEEEKASKKLSLASSSSSSSTQLKTKQEPQTKSIRKRPPVQSPSMMFAAAGPKTKKMKKG